MTHLNTDELISTVLRFEPSAVELLKQSYSEMIVKILFINEEKSGTLKYIRTELQSLLSAPKVSNQQLSRALEYLRSKNLVSRNGKWKLTDKAIQLTKKSLDDADKRVEEILIEHFAWDKTEKIIKEWFLRAGVSYFTKYGNRWVASICFKKSIRYESFELDKILKESFREFGLETKSEELRDRFIGFLTSDKKPDVEHKWILGQSLLMSRMVAGNISKDPISTSTLRGATMILDTNILFVATLEMHKLSQSLASLAEAFQYLEISTNYIIISREQYATVLSAIRDKAKKVIDKFDIAILQDSKDPFITTALEYQVRNSKDMDRFFDQIADPPSSINGIQPITLLDNIEIENAVNDALEDTVLIEEIEHAWLSQRKTKKSRKSSEHDAALLYVIDHLKSLDNNAWIITLDRTLHDYELKNTEKKGIPRVLSLDVLLQLLSFDTSDTNFDPSKFAELFSAIIAFQLEPREKIYTIEDMSWLLEIEERAASLPNDRIYKIIDIVNRASFAGIKRNDTTMHLEIRRAFHGEILELGNIETKIIEHKRDNLEAAFLSLMKKDKKDDAKKILKRVIVISGFASLIAFLISYLGFNASDATKYQIIASILAALVPWLSLFKYIPEYNSKINNLDTEVIEKISQIEDGISF